MSKYEAEKRFQLIEFLGGRCSCPPSGDCWHESSCRVYDDRCLQLDHINGGGSLDARRRGGNGQMIAYYLKHLDEARRNLQILCANCNWVKRDRNKEVGTAQRRWLNNLLSRKIEKGSLTP